MSRLVKKLMVVLLSAFMFMGVMTTPVQAKSSDRDDWGRWFSGWWWWTQPSEPEPEEDSVGEPTAEEMEENETNESVETSVTEDGASDTFLSDAEEPTEDDGATNDVYDVVTDVANTPVYATDPIEAVGENYTATISFGEEAHIPVGTVAVIKEFEETDPEYTEAKNTLIAEKGEEAVAGFVAFDISLYNGETEIEPDAAVNVSIEVKELPAEAIEAADTLEINHLNEQAEETVVEILAVADDIKVSDSGATADVIVNSFSTFTITWYSSRRSATVHHGIVVNNAFVEFGTGNLPVSSNTNYPGNSLNVNSYTSNEWAYLIYDFPGYKYKETRYSRINGTQIWPLLYAYDNNNGWLYFSTSLNSIVDRGEWNGSYTNVVGNDSDIYVIYEQLSQTTGWKPESQTDPSQEEEVEAPEIDKDIDPNGDGTYDITLSVTGRVDHDENIKKANVIVIFDKSGSMNDSFGNGTRLSVGKQAVKKLASKLLGITDNDGNHLVKMALIDFSTTATVHKFENDSVFTENYSGNNGYESAINGISAAGATNWEAALNEANALEAADGAQTYIVFVSDGDPTFRISRMDVTDSYLTSETELSSLTSGGTIYDNTYLRNGLFGTGNRYSKDHYDAALKVAKSIVEHKKNFYTIGLSSDGHRMSDLARDAYPSTETENHYFPGTDQTSLVEAFEKIASYIEKNLGYTNVSLDDGVTDLTRIETSLVGFADNYVYRKGENKDDPTQNDLWTGSDNKSTTSIKDGHVIWELGDTQLEDGVTYSVTFTVWPSQDSYDLIANINNGIKYYDYAKYQQAGGTLSETEAREKGLIITNEQKNQIVINDENNYTLLTNTGLKVDYTYNGADLSDNIEDFPNGAMPLDTSYFAIHKDWVNNLPQDSRTAQVLTKKDEADGKEYLVNSAGDWILDGENRIVYDRDNPSSWKDKAVYYVDLIVTQGDTDYTEVRLTSDTADGQQAWTWDRMFIAPGVITHEKNATSGSLNVRETGHEYSVREKPSESYYWELTAETYHPMVINGENTVLQEVKENAPAMENNTFNGDYYCFDNHVYKKLGTADEALISAINERRSYLNLTKVVVDEDAPEEALFTYTVKINNPNGKHSGEEGYSAYNDGFWFSIYENADAEDPMKNLDPAIYVSGATAEDGNTGYWYADNNGTATIKIKAGWNVRFINLVSGTEYDITEVTSSMAEGFVFDKVEAAATLNGVEQDYTPEITDENISGKIENPNTDYTVTYTNEWDGYFYVYHSSNNTVERFPLAVDGEPVNNPFNIFAETLPNTLYGGYYHNYSKKSEGFDGINVPESAWVNNMYQDPQKTDSTPGSEPYEGEIGLWKADDAITTNGKSIVPESGKTYYLKEVPTYYLKSFTHYTYYTYNDQISNFYFMSGIDDTNYTDVGFEINIEGNNRSATKAVKTLRITNKGGTATLKALTVYSHYGMKNEAYLAYYRDTEKEFLQPGKLTIKQYWKTPDGITVFGDTTRTITVADDLKFNTLQFDDETK